MRRTGGRAFDDGKTFVDATARAKPKAILEAYAQERPVTREELRALVERHFTLPDGTAAAMTNNLVEHI